MFTQDKDVRTETMRWSSPLTSRSISGPSRPFVFQRLRTSVLSKVLACKKRVLLVAFVGGGESMIASVEKQQQQQQNRWYLVSRHISQPVAVDIWKD